MRTLPTLFVVTSLFVAASCGGGGGGGGGGGPAPRVPIAPADVTFTPGPATPIAVPFGTAPYTMRDTELASIDDDAICDLGWTVTSTLVAGLENIVESAGNTGTGTAAQGQPANDRRTSPARGDSGSAPPHAR